MARKKSLVCVLSEKSVNKPYSYAYPGLRYVLVVITFCKELTEYYAMKIALHLEPSTNSDYLTRISVFVERQGYCRFKAKI